MAQVWNLGGYDPMAVDQAIQQNRLRGLRVQQAEGEMQRQNALRDAMGNLYTEEPVTQRRVSDVNALRPGPGGGQSGGRAGPSPDQMQRGTEEVQVGTRRRFNPDALDEIMRLDPGTGAKIQQMRAQQSEVQRAQEDREAAIIAHTMDAVEQADDPEEAYRRSRRFLAERGVDVTDMPQQYEPMVANLARARAATADLYEMPEAQGMDVPDVETFYDDQGRPYKAQWVNGQWQRVGGSKADTKSPLAIERKLQLAGIAPNSEEGKRLIMADLLGQQISVEPTEDGPRISIGKGAGMQGLTTKEKGMAGEGRFNAQERLSRLQTIRKKFDPDALTYEASLDRFFSSLRDKSETLQSIFGPLSEQERETLSEEAKLLRNVYDNLNQTLKEMSGAAINAEEAKRLKQAIPSPDDSPTEFKAKLEDAIEKQRRALMRYNYMLNQKGSFNRRNPQFGLDEVPQIVNQAGQRIEDEVRKRHPEWTDDEVTEAVTARVKSLFFQTPEQP